MLFNSLLFIGVFLPVTLVGFWALAALGLGRLRLVFLIIMSLVFYGNWAPEYTILLLLSVGLNFLCARFIAARRGSPSGAALLYLGVIGNLAALGYFKYANFFVDQINAVTNAGIDLAPILLPLAISFYTFQQVAFLIEVNRGEIEPGDPLSYTAFVIFFPQLIAGPIVTFQELAPQLKTRPVLSRASETILIGLIIFGIGLAKKTIFADTAALYATPVFDGARDGASPGALLAWGSALAYTLQVYFDFSGYSDMAIGLARMFGVLLPVNFHSPLKARSIAELWRRWHITLGRFVQSYIFRPISMPMARIAAQRAAGRWTSLAVSVLLPSFLAMVVIGTWHGAGWNFVLFGALHGLFVVTNEAFSFARKRTRKKGGWKAKLFAELPTPVACTLMMVAFTFAVVPFRAEGFAATLTMFQSMLFAASADPGMSAALWPGAWPGFALVVVIGLALIYLFPNTQQIMSGVTPVLEWPRWAKVANNAVLSFIWSPKPIKNVLAGAVLALGIAFIFRGTTEFIYFNF